MAHASLGLADASAEAPAAAGKAPNLLVRALAWIAEQRRISRTIATLSELSDHTLADIGIARSDIPHVARYGRTPAGAAR